MDDAFVTHLGIQLSASLSIHSENATDIFPSLAMFIPVANITRRKYHVSVWSILTLEDKTLQRCQKSFGLNS